MPEAGARITCPQGRTDAATRPTRRPLPVDRPDFGPVDGPAYFRAPRWRSTSNKATPVATETFRLSISPGMGILAT